MRRAAAVLIVVVSVAALSAQARPPARGPADRSADEAAIQKLNDALVDATASGNFKQAGALWDEDGTYYSLEGDKVTGPAQIEGALAEKAVQLREPGCTHGVCDSTNCQLRLPAQRRQ